MDIDNNHNAESGLLDESCRGTSRRDNLRHHSHEAIGGDHGSACGPRGGEDSREPTMHDITNVAMVHDGILPQVTEAGKGEADDRASDRGIWGLGSGSHAIPLTNPLSEDLAVLKVEQRIVLLLRDEDTYDGGMYPFNLPTEPDHQYGALLELRNLNCDMNPRQLGALSTAGRSCGRAWSHVLTNHHELHVSRAEEESQGLLARRWLAS
ncbi:uncharacterized protein B0I36DRAFT_355285 [Microdochium trichocladiopsis]|uniref:Uncharacterized protein n=1 Tax=Microdochium trichocladiopsis TaxID=1682393 RepID=A0A9P8XTX8_9PEZI|nr:uncharacterized protein B0I36DRAFT_355285 [Microdochium trichocladiopsis]KAH7016504.1 hypothetical protein B0I36DRAFT_355285 [Microdochium trichocladiopsis]